MRISVILAAAGSSTRMGLSRSKVLLPLLDKPVLCWSLDLFQKDPEVTEILVTASEKDRNELTRLCKKYGKARVVAGGATRSISVTMALSRVSPAAQKVAVHDGARPLLSEEDWLALKEAARENPAVIPLHAMTDSMKSLAGGEVKTLPRDQVASVQTPQIFDYHLLLSAYRNAVRNGITATDDSELVERMGTAIKGIYTQDPNFKITYQEDLLFAELLLRMDRQEESK